MTAVRFLSIVYLLGAAVFAFALLVILLAFAGVETFGSRINIGFPLIGGFLVMMGSKFAASAVLRRAEKR